MRRVLSLMAFLLWLSMFVWFAIRQAPVTLLSTIESQPKLATPRIVWVGGGRRGATEEQAQAKLDAVFESVFRGWNRAELYKLATNTRVLQDTIVSLAARLGPSPDDPADDCFVHLVSHSRALCLIAAALDVHYSDGGNATWVPLRDRPLYANSNCRIMTPCLYWRSGTFRRPISAAELTRVFRDHVVPKLVDPDCVDVFITNESQGATRPQLADRIRTHRDWISKRYAAYHRRVLRKPFPVPPHAGPEWDEVADVESLRRYAFDGHDLRLNVSDGTFSCDGRNTVPLTPFEMLSVLYMRSRKSAATRESVFGHGAVVFQGDSTTREVFSRLIHYIRHGDEPERRFDEPAQHVDIVHRVYATHDDFEEFYVPLSGITTNRTLANHFLQLKRRGTPPPEQPLLTVIFLWDPIGSLYRADTLAPLAPLKPFIEAQSSAIEGSTLCPPAGMLDEYNFLPGLIKMNTRLLSGEKTTGTDVTAQASRSLRDHGVRIAVHLFGQLFAWEANVNPATWQHLFVHAAARRTDSNLHDQTDLLLISPSLEDALQPWYRHVAPRQDQQLPHHDNNHELKDQQNYTVDVGTRENEAIVSKIAFVHLWLQHTEAQRSNTSAGPFAFVDSLQILDKGRVQLLGIAQGDNRHYSCRFPVVLSYSVFNEGFSRFALMNPLRMKGSPEYSLLSVTNGAASDSTLTVSALVDNAVRSLNNSELRQELWVAAGMDRRVYNSPHYQILLDKHEFGIVVHDDNADCHDHGDLLLLQLVARKLARSTMT